MIDLTGLTKIAGQKPCSNNPDAGCVQYYADSNGKFYKVSTSGMTGQTTKEEVRNLPNDIAWINKVRAQLTTPQKWGVIIGVTALAYFILHKSGSLKSI